MANASMTIHNFIRRKSETDFEFKRYEDDNIDEHENDDHMNEDQSLPETVFSSTEMDFFQDLIRD